MVCEKVDSKAALMASLWVDLKAEETAGLWVLSGEQLSADQRALKTASKTVV